MNCILINKKNRAFQSLYMLHEYSVVQMNLLRINDRYNLT
jgi:hypothetical protein